MKGLSIITGGLVGLAAPVLVVGATVGANVLSISRDALRATKKKVSTANGITIDPGYCTGDHVMYEALLRRPARKDRQCPRGRHIQVWRCPPVRRQPLLSQALREDRRSRRPSQAEERSREAPEN